MKRRNFLGLIAAAPVAVPALLKAEPQTTTTTPEPEPEQTTLTTHDFFGEDTTTTWTQEPDACCHWTWNPRIKQWEIDEWKCKDCPHNVGACV